MPSSRRSKQSSAQSRITVTLDPRMELENWVLRVLDTIPPDRRQEWLRGLLVAGFIQHRSQSRMVQGRDGAIVAPRIAEAAPETVPPSTFTNYLTRGQIPAGPTPSVQPVQSPQQNPGISMKNDKPFAQLRKVIGA